MYAAKLCKFRGPPRFDVGGRVFGWGVRGDKVSDLGKAVVEPTVNCVWSRESRRGRE